MKKKIRAALVTTVTVIAALIVGKALLGAFLHNPAGFAHGVKWTWNAGAQVANSLEIFIGAGGWAAVLALILIGALIVSLIRQ